MVTVLLPISPCILLLLYLIEFWKLTSAELGGWDCQWDCIENSRSAVLAQFILWSFSGMTCSVANLLLSSEYVSIIFFFIHLQMELCLNTDIIKKWKRMIKREAKEFIKRGEVFDPLSTLEVKFLRNLIEEFLEVTCLSHWLFLSFLLKKLTVFFILLILLGPRFWMGKCSLRIIQVMQAINLLMPMGW